MKKIISFVIFTAVIICLASPLVCAENEYELSGFKSASLSLAVYVTGATKGAERNGFIVKPPPGPIWLRLKRFQCLWPEKCFMK